MNRLVLFALLCATIDPGSGTAQIRTTFGGIYTADTPNGTQLTLTLVEDRTGRVTGTLASHATTFDIEAAVERGRLTGTIYVERDGLFFEAVRDGGELRLLLTDGGTGFDYLRNPELVFAFQGTSPRDFGAAPRVPGADPLRGGNPLGLGNPLAPDFPDGTGNFSGTYTDGFVTLEIVGGGATYSGRIRVSGREYPFEADLVETELHGRFGNGVQTFAFSAVRDGPFLVLESEGQVYYLRFRGARSAGGDWERPDVFEPPPGAPRRGGWGNGSLSDGHPESIEWVDYLAHRRVSSHGGTRRDRGPSAISLELCDTGEFIDLASATRRHADGAWRVISPRDRATYLELRYDSGMIERLELSIRSGDVYLDRYPAFLGRSLECR